MKIRGELRLEDLEVRDPFVKKGGGDVDEYWKKLMESEMLAEEKKEFLRELEPFDFGETPEFVGEEGLEECDLQLVDNNKHYFGQRVKKLPHGKGVLLYPDNGLHIGWFKFGMAQGKGRQISSDNHIYEGEWERNKANGFGT
mmetsp:Transcript_48361/g.35560  ORF Transcript_48361/g.35560 Transcript_48361/m.35560 type:complete len:142 (-) Transcript_48361:21-446(-)